MQQCYNAAMSETFAEYVERKLKEKNWRIVTLSQKSGVSVSYLYRIIKRPQVIPSPAILRKLASALNVHENEMMTAAGYTSPPQDEELILVRQLQRNPLLGELLADMLRLPREDLEELQAIVRLKKRRREAGGGR
jgi:transcriptional regulator with XRE-family HTH domain